MLDKINTAKGTLILFTIIGLIWYSCAHFIHDSNLHNILVITFTFLFCAMFMWSLFNSLQRIYGDYGNLWKELALSSLNVFLFFLGFSAVYAEIGIIDTTTSGNPITHDFWSCCYYSVITFTSTGYGDFRPAGIARVLASLHAIIGYLVLGQMASTGVSIVQWTAEGSGKNRGTNKKQNQNN